MNSLLKRQRLKQSTKNFRPRVLRNIVVLSFKEILEGKHDDIPENLFLNAGNMDDVLARVK